MNYCKTILTVASIGISVASVSLAKPIECPSATTIINKLAADEPKPVGPKQGKYFVVWNLNVGNLATNSWMFFIKNIEANSLNDAALKAHDALMSLSGTPEPVKENGWTRCTYHVEYEYEATASLTTYLN